MTPSTQAPNAFGTANPHALAIILQLLFGSNTQFLL